MNKKLMISLLVTGLLLGSAYFGVGNYFYNYALNAHEEKEFMEDNPNLAASAAIDPETEAAEKQADQAFKETIQPSDWTLFSEDKQQLQLHANLYENGENHAKWAIVVHGYGSNAASMTRWVRGFYEQGYQVLAPDLRGHGKSEGNYIGMGWPDRLDLLTWINQIVEEDPQAEIVLFGVSMGGATVMSVSGEELPANVKVIVEDCGYTSVSDVFTYQLDDQFGLPEFPVIPAANTVTKIRAGYDLYQASALSQVAKSSTPMLFIHGDQDTFVPFEMVNQVYEAAGVEKEKLVIPGAQHGDAVKVNPKLYWETIWNFVSHYIS